MEDRKERIDGILRYFVIGYPLMFLFVWMFFLAFRMPMGLIRDINSFFYYSDISAMVILSQFPLSSLATFGILVGARYIMFGKTYQK